MGSDRIYCNPILDRLRPPIKGKPLRQAAKGDAAQPYSSGRAANGDLHANQELTGAYSATVLNYLGLAVCSVRGVVFSLRATANASLIRCKSSNKLGR